MSQSKTVNDINTFQKLYVDTLVDITSLTIRTSWSMEMVTTNDGQPVVNTQAFVRHLLKRSRATRSTLQLAIFYLFRIRPQLAKRSQIDPIVKCGRRMFLAALICAHKYLYDNTFTNASWAKISRLPVKEINQAERSLLEMLDYRLFVSTELYQKFEAQLQEAMPEQLSSATPLTGKRMRSIEEDNSEPQPQLVKKHRPVRTTYGIPTPEDENVQIF
ncbi:hypothetical protein K501DRAFT_259381 [Backusella circina FSU 941]|nr:hypothetical protein K501DRAFT_259381 [Backusella circina FSU 941]